MKFRIHPAAEEEAEDAAEWYGARIPTLGIEFARSHVQAIDSIVENPQIYPVAEDTPADVECRNMLQLGRFPYLIVEDGVDDAIYILAVAHRNRRPGYWKNRVTDTPPEAT